MVSKKAVAKAKRREMFSLKRYLERKEQKKHAREHGHHHH
jgi:hypothetical protein